LKYLFGLFGSRVKTQRDSHYPENFPQISSILYRFFQDLQVIQVLHYTMACAKSSNPALAYIFIAVCIVVVLAWIIIPYILVNSIVAAYSGSDDYLFTIVASSALLVALALPCVCRPS
jgi:hypothetical protein